jgi:hypothetical protein
VTPVTVGGLVRTTRGTKVFLLFSKKGIFFFFEEKRSRKPFLGLAGVTGGT